RHMDALERGAMEGGHPLTEEAASRRLAEQLDSAVSMIDSHKPFKKISEAFGRIAGTIATLNNPLWGEMDGASRIDGASKTDGARKTGGAGRTDDERFSSFIHERMDRFPL